MSFTKPLIFLILLLTHLSVWANYPRGLVANVNGKLVTGDDVLLLSSALRLNDSIRIKLFNQANRDLKLYKKIKKTWLKKFFNQDLKTILYTNTIRNEARMVTVTTGRRVAFNFKTSDYNSLMQELENKALSSWLDAGQGMQVATLEFGKLLHQRGYPADSSMSYENIYYLWREHQESSIKEKIRVNEVKKFERYIGTYNNYDLKTPIHDFRVNTFFERHRKIVQQRLNGVMSQKSKIKAAIGKTSGSNFVIKQLSFISFGESKFREINSYAPELLESYSELYETFIQTYSTSNKADQISKYIDHAFQLRKRHSSKELRQKYKRQMQLYNNDRTNISKLILAKTVLLAAEIDPTTQPDSVNYMAIVANSNLKHNFSEYLEMSLKDLALMSLKELFTHRDVSPSVTNYVGWLIGLELQNFLNQQEGKIKIDYIDLTDYKSRAMIHSKFLQDSIQEKINSFKEDLATRYSKSNYLRLANDDELEDEEALLFVIK